MIGTTDRQTAIGNAERAAQQNKVSPAPVATPDHYVITCTPLTATITHRNSFIDPATKLPAYSRSVHFLEKQGNGWKAVSNAGGGLTDAQRRATVSIKFDVKVRANNSQEVVDVQNTVGMPNMTLAQNGN